MIGRGHQQVEKAKDGILSVAKEINPAAPQSHEETPRPEITTPITPITPITTEKTAKRGTACLPCCRDHFITVSGSLSEGLRFARENFKDPELLRRIRIALGELDIMERIDLAPEEMSNLGGKERELAEWSLMQSRQLRHAITAIKDAKTMEQAAAKASSITDEFMSNLWAIPEEECETCGEIREKISEFIEQRKRERGEG